MKKYTKSDLKNLKLFILKNENYLSNFISDSEILADEIYKKIQTDELLHNFKNYSKWIIKIMIVKCSDIYHEIFKCSDYAYLRELIVKYSNKYDDYFSNDDSCQILKYLAKKSDKYHDKFKNSKYASVRFSVAKYSDKYDDHFKNDPYWKIRKLVNSRNLKESILDINKSYKISFDNQSNITLIIDNLKLKNFNVLENFSDENSYLFISTFDDIKIACFDTIEKFQGCKKFYKKISIKKLNELIGGVKNAIH